MCNSGVCLVVWHGRETVGVVLSIGAAADPDKFPDNCDVYRNVGIGAIEDGN